MPAAQHNRLMTGYALRFLYCLMSFFPVFSHPDFPGKEIFCWWGPQVNGAKKFRIKERYGSLRTDLSFLGIPLCKTDLASA